NWGVSIIKPFSKFILWSFKLLHTIIPNYGVVIVVFSILIKIVLWPLTHKSYVSMKKMSNLQPYMKEIKEKYKGDPQKMQKETAKLYKEHNVNPMGGCLPMILQMPLLYGLFIVFRSTIELRGAPFMWWIKDLSLPDTIIELGFTIPMYGNQISVLPLVMGVSTFFQSKQTMTDPNQKMMLYFMPIFLTLLFNNFPSGLTLYYTLFNLLSVVQQRMIQTNNKAAVEVGKK
ncbi:MAG: membrane protein insertase YidC, partial [FCB group bacterium]|nr:membrane protein insertase YidC [FCB group bacterium]